MKQLVLVGALAGVVSLASVVQAAPMSQARGSNPAAKPADSQRTPRQQPATASSPALPTGELALGTVRLSKAVKADGKPLPAGTYQVRLTTQTPAQEAKGQTPGSERWIEFLQGGQVKGREVATIVPQAEIKEVEKDTPPAVNSSKVETLKGGDYVRLWINRGGNHYLIHFPAA